MNIQIPIADLQKKSIFVATPMYGGQCMGTYTKSILDMSRVFANYNIPLQFSFLFNESLITRARNYMTAEFLATDNTHLLFIDADIDFNPMDAIALLALDKPIICAPYPKKTVAWENVYDAIKYGLVPNDDRHKMAEFAGDFVFNFIPGTTEINLQEPVQVLESGTGFMLVERSVFQQFAEKFPEYWYTPDHNRSAAFNGTKKIYQYFQAEIDPVSTRYLSEDYWFCVPSRSTVDTEDGPKTIKSIVDSKYTGKVASLSPDGTFEYKPVVGWSVRSNKGDSKKKWVRLNTNSSNNRTYKLYCTDDHKVATVRDIFTANSEVEFVEAGSTTGRYTIRKPQAHDAPLYNADQLQALLGTLLGDASVSKSGQVSVGHCVAQSGYVEYKKNLFGGSEVVWDEQHSGFGQGKLYGRTNLRVNAQTKALRELLHPNNGPKTIANVVDMIDERALAFWYMDDGTRDGNSCAIATYCFDESDHATLVSLFKVKWNIDAIVTNKSMVYRGTKRDYRYIRFNKDGAIKLFNLVAPYTHESHRHKIPDNMPIGTIALNQKSSDIAAALVTSVEYLPNYHSRLYDIEVQDNHNFVTQQTVVHNCQKARAAGSTVWLAPWMQLKHHGSYVYSGSIPAMATVVNERIKRGEKAPATIPQDVKSNPTVSVKAITAEEAKVSVLSYNNFSKKQKAKVVEELAAKFNTPVEELTEILRKNLARLVVENPNGVLEDVVGNIEIDTAAAPTETEPKQ